MLTFAQVKKRPASVARRSPLPAAAGLGPMWHDNRALVRRALRGPALQTKLSVSKPGDALEREAGRVADQVMAMPDADVAQRQPENDEEEETLRTKPLVDQITPLVQRQEEPPEEEEEALQAKPLADQITPLVQRQEESPEEEEEEELQAKSNPGETPAVTPAISSSIQSLQGGGQPLSRSEQSFFEPRFGADFSKVRVHNDSQAARVARSVNARAFTLGRNVVFAAGEYSPDTSAGRNLLAHELTHTVQQKGNAQRKIQRAMKFEIQTINHVWMVDKKGAVKPVPRKYGIKGRSEKGEEQFLTTGVAGKPHVRRRDFVEAKEVDPSKPAQYVWTYTVIDETTGEVSRPEKKRNRGKVNRRTYELKYVDATGNSLDVHRDGFGRFQPGLGPLMRKAKRTIEGSAVELQAESGGFVEFETPKWHRKWSAIKARIEEAQNMTKDMDGAPVVTDEDTKDAVREKIDKLKDSGDRDTSMGTLHKWPAHFRIGHLPVIRRGGHLLVEIIPGGTNWLARIQASESLALQEFESLLEEHETAAKVIDTLGPAQTMFDSLKPAGAARAMLFEIDHANLKGLLQMIVFYIVSGQGFTGKPNPSKSAFRLMARTSFYSIYQSLLNKNEQALFRKLVKAKTIPSTLLLTNSDPVFKRGHGRVAAGSKDNPKIGAWLVSIYRGGGWHPDKRGKKTDLMSRPKRGSAAMGRFDVDTREGKKHSGLVRIEVRLSEKHMGGNDQPRDDWLSYVRKVFEQALAERSARPGVSAIDAGGNELLDE